jgi:hypothetical protein
VELDQPVRLPASHALVGLQFSLSLGPLRFAPIEGFNALGWGKTVVKIHRSLTRAVTPSRTTLKGLKPSSKNIRGRIENTSKRLIAGLFSAYKMRVFKRPMPTPFPRYFGAIQEAFSRAFWL